MLSRDSGTKRNSDVKEKGLSRSAKIACAMAPGPIAKLLVYGVARKKRDEHEESDEESEEEKEIFSLSSSF